MIKKIQERRVATRLLNDKKLNRKYKAWNKGKTNVYSKNTIEKIRNATIKQLHDQKYKKKEEKIENFLKEKKNKL